MTETKTRTLDEIQAEIGDYQRKLAATPPPPFWKQEEILMRIIDLLKERKGASNG